MTSLKCRMYEHLLRVLTSNSYSMTSVNAPQNPRLPLFPAAPPHRYRWLWLRTCAWRQVGKKTLRNNSRQLSVLFCFFKTTVSSAPFHVMGPAYFWFFFHIWVFFLTNTKHNSVPPVRQSLQLFLMFLQCTVVNDKRSVPGPISSPCSEQ